MTFAKFSYIYAPFTRVLQLTKLTFVVRVEAFASRNESPLTKPFVMANQLVKEQKPGSDKTPESQTKHHEKTSTLSLTDGGPSSLSPEMTACPIDGEIPSLPQLGMISVAGPASSQHKVAKQFLPSIFDSKLTTRPRHSKKRKQFTYDNYDSEYNRLSLDQQYSKGMQDSIFGAKQESIPATTSDQLKTIPQPEGSNVEPPELQLERMYDALSQKLIEEVLMNVELSAKGEFVMTNNRCTVRRVASMVGTFVTHNHARLILAERDRANPVTSDGKSVKSSWLARLEAKREKVAKNLSFNHQDCYSAIIPVNIVVRLNKAQSCIADKVRKDKYGNLRCSRTTSIDVKAARRLLNELAKLPQPRDFSAVAKLLEDVIGYAFCERWHQGKARAGLERLRSRFSQPLDDTRKTEQEAERTQLAQWISRMIEPLVSRDTVHHHEVVSGHGSNNNSDHANDLPSKEPAKIVKQELKSSLSTSALLAFKKDTLSLKSTEVSIAPFAYTSHFQKYTWSKAHRDLSPERLVEKIAKSKLTDGDIPRKGRIYVFWNPGDFGYLKVGYTEQKGEERIEEWKAQCGLDASEIYPRKEDEDPISHPLRVEQLIHAEMKDKRYQTIACQGCQKSHVEWFQTDEKHALAIVKKWTKWMKESNPYDEKGYFKTDVEVILPPLVGQQTAKVILKPARGGRLSSRVKHSPVRRSLRIATQETSRESKQI